MMLDDLTRFWQALEAIPILSAVGAEWRSPLGPEYERVQPFFRPQPGFADSFPNPNGLPYEVRRCGEEYVGVCQETGGVISLTSAQLVIQELDRQRFTRSLATALGLDHSEADDKTNARTILLGRFQAASTTTYSCFLTFPVESDDIQTTAARHLAEKQAPFILFGPTRRWARRQVPTLLRFHGCVFAPLAEIITCPSPGKLLATKSLNSVVAGATGVVSVATANPTRNSSIVFRSEGAQWELTFDGKTVKLQDSLGLRCLARVIGVKRLPVDTRLLKAEATGNQAVKPGDGFTVFDRGGLGTYSGGLPKPRRRACRSDGQ